MHEKNIALLCDEADRLLQLNINLLRQMVEEPDVLSDSKNENRLLFDKQKALKRIEELEGEQIKTARREMVLAVVGTMKAGKSTTINAIVGQEILPNRNRPMTSVPTLIRHVPGKTEPVLHLEHIQPVRNLLITLQEKLATLTAREHEMLQQLLQGYSSKEIARLCSLSPRTVEAHRANIFSKLEVNSLPKLLKVYADIASGSK